PLDRLLAALAGGAAHVLRELERELLHVELADDLEHRLGAHLRLEEAELLALLTVLGLGEDLHPLDLVGGVALGARLVADDLHVRRDLLLHDAEVLIGADADDLVVRARLDRAGAVRDRLLQAADLALRLVLDRLRRALLLVLVDVRHDVEREVEDALEVARRHVEEDAETARRPLEEPDVRHRRGELDVAHTLAADLRARHLDAALVADDPLVPDALVLAAVALPVTGRPKDALVEEAVLLGTQRAIVDRLRLRH